MRSETKHVVVSSSFTFVDKLFRGQGSPPRHVAIGHHIQQMCTSYVFFLRTTSHEFDNFLLYSDLILTYYESDLNLARYEPIDFDIILNSL